MLVRLEDMANTKPLIHLVMDQELVDRIDDFRFANRFPSRNAAIKYMLLAFLDQPTAPEPAQGERTLPQPGKRRGPILPRATEK
jgi:Arc/MetJ-type ribon-helix-helix transcriptional regulator